MEMGNFDKAVSALYFAVRKRLERILNDLRHETPRRDDKLANVLRHLGYREEAEGLMRLYELRKKADYGEEKVTKEEAEFAMNVALSVLKAIEELSDPG